ncbi:hypothetical protein ScPMuIL_018088 [Solemya velum]
MYPEFSRYTGMRIELEGYATNYTDMWVTEDNFTDFGDTIVLPRQFLPEYKNPCWYVYKEDQSPMLRCLPYFYVLGMEKSGTTDLYATLIKHPHIVKPGIKDPLWITSCHFLRNKSLARGCEGESWRFDWYLDIFQVAADSIQTMAYGGEVNPYITGDFSQESFFRWQMASDYIKSHQDTLQYKSVPEFLFMLNKKVKLIVTLRNPTDRLYSDFGMVMKERATPDLFHRSVIEAIKLWNNCVSKHSELICAAMDTNLHQNFWRTVRLHMGAYHIYFKEWLKVFPRDQILVIKFEDYARNRSGIMAKITDFLELEPYQDEKSINSMRVYNSGKKMSIWNKTRSLLTTFYNPHNEELAELLEDTHFLYTSN